MSIYAAIIAIWAGAALMAGVLWAWWNTAGQRLAARILNGRRP